MPTDDPRTNDALDELAAMYLTGAADRPDTEAPPPPPVRAPKARPAAQLLLVGHLPGPANLWINQHVQRLVADHRRAVAVVHLSADTVDLDLHTTGSRRSPLPGSISFPEAVAAAASYQPLWLVHVGQDDDPISHHLAGCFDDWLLLTGADEAAIVAAYRLLKRRLDSRGPDLARPRVRLWFMGSAAAHAEQAASRLHRTAAAHLRLTPVLAGVHPKMTPVRRQRLAGFVRDAIDPTELLNMLMSLPASPIEIPPTFTLRKPDETAAAPLHAVPAPDESSPAASIRLVDHVPQLTLLEARCPYHKSVELAVDPQGRLHLLLHDVSVENPLVAMVETARWSRDHGLLLQLTPGAQSLDPLILPALHLFTATPKPYQRLAASEALYLHLLMPVSVGSNVTWTHVALN